MKKTFLLIFFIFLFYFTIAKFITHNNLLPEDAIRMRIIPNSNTKEDQAIKMKVKEKVEKDVFTILEDVKGSSEARKRIIENINVIDQSVKDVLYKENYTLGYKINYGMNYFPEKKYKGVKYKAGEYESLVVTLGEGKGKNWWCVLFPPLCLVEASESDEAEYKLWIQEMIEKYM